jgi:hypothetical protein
VQRVLFTVNDYGVSGVVTAIELNDVVNLRSKLVGCFALALVSPLGTDDYYGWHWMYPLSAAAAYA